MSSSSCGHGYSHPMLSNYTAPLVPHQPPLALQNLTSKRPQAMSKAYKEKSSSDPDAASGSHRKPSSTGGAAPASTWHTATAGMYTAEGLAALRNSQAFTPKPSSGGSDRRRRGERMRGSGAREGGDDEASATESSGARGGEARVFAGEEAEIVHEAGEQGGLNEEVMKFEGRPWS